MKNKTNLIYKASRLFAFFSLLITVYSVNDANAQIESANNQEYNNMLIEDILDDLSRYYNIDIVIIDASNLNYRIDEDLSGLDLGQSLRELLDGTGYFFLEIDQKVYVLQSDLFSEFILKKVSANITNKEIIEGVKNIRPSTLERKTLDIRGKVLDETNNEAVSGVRVFNSITKEGAVSQIDGSFELKGYLGLNSIKVVGYGFSDQRLDVKLVEDTSLVIKLSPDIMVIDEVVVTGANLKSKINQPLPGLEKMNIKQIEELPTFMGEVDVVKSIIALPGVNSVGEGAGGFNVRGGNVDENLLVYDGIPLFNSSHLFGFFSVFNPESIESFELYKGGFPARYGGRSSSVLDVKSKKGDFESYKITGGIGVVTGKLGFDGPIVKNFLSTKIDVRKSYSSLASELLDISELRDKNADFYDVSFRADAKLNNSSSLSSTIFTSDDTYQYVEDTISSSLNKGISLEFIKSFSNTNSIILNGAISENDLGASGLSEDREFQYASRIRQTIFSVASINTISENSSVELGYNFNYYTSDMGRIDYENESYIDNEAGVENAYINSIYLDFTNETVESLKVNLGLRSNIYTNLSNGVEYIYREESMPYEDIVDSVNYNSKTPYRTKVYFEPRLSTSFNLADESSLKFGYNTSYQFVNLITNSIAISPLSIWKLSDQHIKPRITHQLSFGYFKSIDKIVFQVEPYYKFQKNLIEIEAGGNTFVNPYIEQELLLAEGRSYGVEVKLEKSGRLNGWLSYTFSNSRRRLISSTNESVSNEWFYSSYDIPHSVNVVVNYKLSKRISVSSNFVFNSGRPFTIPKSVFEYRGVVYAAFSKRNDGRIPNYHRLDFSINFKPSIRKNKLINGEWGLSIYNLYARKNPFSVFYGSVGNGRLPQAYKLSILGNVFPALNYNFTITPRKNESK